MKSAPLALGGIAALLASACCLGPLKMVSVGVGGAWLSNFQVLEPYRPFFVGISLVALGFAWKHIYRPPRDCKPGEVCTVPRVRRGYKAVFWTVAAFSTATLAFPYFAPYFY